MIFDVAPWLLSLIAALGLGPWVASMPAPNAIEVLLYTMGAALSPLLIAELAGRFVRRRDSPFTERILVLFCYLAPLAAAAALVCGRLPAFITATFPDAPNCVHVACALAPAAIIVLTTVLAERRAFLLAKRFEPPRFADRLRIAVLPLFLPPATAAVVDGLQLFHTFRIYYQSYTLVQLATFGAIAIVFLAFFPRIVFFAVRSHPLEAGPIRDLFYQIARQLDVKIVQFRVIKTGHSVANAALLGGLGARFVIITDKLLWDHPPEELAAVVGHEIGHARGRHLRLFAVFLGAAGVWIMNIPAAWFDALGQLPAAAGGIGALILIIRFGLGPLARACEHDADLYGVAIVGSPAPLTNSLARIAGPERLEHSGWRHPSVRARADFLARHFDDANVSVRLRRRIRNAERASLGALALGIGFALWIWSADFPRERIVASLRKSDFTTAMALLNASEFPELEALRPLAEAGARTGGAGADALRNRARAAFVRGEVDDASVLAQLAALRSGKPTDEIFASVVAAVRDGGVEIVTSALAGPALFIARDPRLRPAVDRALERLATRPANSPGKRARGG